MTEIGEPKLCSIYLWKFSSVALPGIFWFFSNCLKWSSKPTPKVWLARHVVKEDNWERSFVPSQSKMVGWGNLPVIQAIPPSCLKGKEWLYCCIARRIAGTTKWQLLSVVSLGKKNMRFSGGNGSGEMMDRSGISVGLSSWAPRWVKSDWLIVFFMNFCLLIVHTSFGIWSWFRMCLRIWVFSLNFSFFSSSKRMLNNNNDKLLCQITLSQEIEFVDIFILPIYASFITLN